MATNEVFKPGYNLSVVVTNPTTPVSGGPVRFGKLSGIAMTDESAGGNESGKTSVYFGPGVFDLVVDDNEGTGIAVGDLIFYHDTPSGSPATNLNNSSSGADAFFGVAMEVVSTNGTTTIQVRHVDSGFTAPIGSTVDTAQLAAEAVTVAKLDGELQNGFIPIPLTSFRLIGSNDIPASGSADGGVISQDTAPKLERVNDATDKKLRIVWAASGVVEITADFPYPNDLDDASDVTVHLLAKMATGGMDTPVIAVGYFEGVGDSNAGGNTAALSTTLQHLTVAIDAANVGAYPTAASLSLTPGAHGNEAAELYACWITYVRAGS